MRGISVIVCSFNAASRIGPTLVHLANQKISSEIAWEVILVNNASTDDTVSVACRTWKDHTHGQSDFKVVDQPVPGLSFARKKGVECSSYNVLIFCDDDNHLTENYLETAVKLLDANANAGIVGGLAKPRLPVEEKNWIKDMYPALAIGPQAPAEGFVNWVYGAGMVIRKQVFYDLAAHNITTVLTDRMGNKHTSGGDSEICLLAKFIGYEIYYSPELILFHAISARRLSKRAFIKSNFRNLFSLIYLHLLLTIVVGKNYSLKQVYASYFGQRIKSLFYFTPRCVVGNHRFYSFMMLYQNMQLLVWLVVRRGKFGKMFQQIEKNLKLI